MLLANLRYASPTPTRSVLLCIRTWRKSRLNHGVGRFASSILKPPATGTKPVFAGRPSLLQQAWCMVVTAVPCLGIAHQ